MSKFWRLIEMKILENQTIYKCSFCGQRKLTKRGCLMHEFSYCKNESSPHMINQEAMIKEMQDEHTKDLKYV